MILNDTNYNFFPPYSTCNLDNKRNPVNARFIVAASKYFIKPLGQSYISALKVLYNQNGRNCKTEIPETFSGVHDRIQDTKIRISCVLYRFILF